MVGIGGAVSVVVPEEIHVTANPTIIGPLGLKEIWTTARAN